MDTKDRDWIRETRDERPHRESPPAPHLDGPEAGVDHLAGHVGRLVDVLTEKLKLLRELRDQVPEQRRAELERKLEDFDDFSRSWRGLPPPAAESEAPPPEPGSPPPEPGAGEPGGILRVTPESFAREVLEADAPVLLGLRVAGDPAGQAADEALLAIGRSYPGELKLCTADLMRMDPEELPRMLKLGREFIAKDLPALQLYWRGRKVRDATGEVDVERWSQLIGSEVDRPDEEG